MNGAYSPPPGFPMALYWVTTAPVCTKMKVHSLPIVRRLPRAFTRPFRGRDLKRMILKSADRYNGSLGNWCRIPVVLGPLTFLPAWR